MQFYKRSSPKTKVALDSGTHDTKTEHAEEVQSFNDQLSVTQVQKSVVCMYESQNNLDLLLIDLAPNRLCLNPFGFNVTKTIFRGKYFFAKDHVVACI